MNFIIKMSDGNRFIVSSEEAKAIANAEKGASITLKNKGIIIERSFVVSVYPESKADEIEDKKNQKTGVLHDGTLVEKHYNGRWVVLGKTVPDDKGNYVPIEIDQEYYPEVKRLCIPTEKEFKKIRHLQPAERLGVILKNKKTKELGQGELNNKPNLINKLLTYGKFETKN